MYAPMNASSTSSASRAALVTGAGRRLGREIALALARQGWDIAVHCRQSLTEAHATAAEIAALGRRAVVLQADLADEAACRALLPAAVQELGATCVLSAVVNSASLFEYDTAATFSYAM